jgi:predicted RNase H-like HicB family nuclease
MDRFIVVTLTVHREGPYYVAKCVELGTSSFGDTEEEALQNLQDATMLYLDTLEELGECDETLRRLGVPIHSGWTARHTIRLPRRSFRSRHPHDQGSPLFERRDRGRAETGGVLAPQEEPR